MHRAGRVVAREVEWEDVALVHSPDHIQLLAALGSDKPTHAGGDMFANAHTLQAARLACGAVLAVTEAVCSGECSNGVALVRPPGHHAEPDAAMGFCWINNVAVAAAVAKARLGARRVLVVDWDVHHGNGTEKVFAADPDVMYVSLHRYDSGSFFPGTGHPNFVGTGAGRGYNINIGWNRSGVTDADMAAAFDQVVMPVARAFDPELVIVSAGFDAAIGDPLGGCSVTPAGYALMTQQLMGLAAGRFVLALEGGYNLKAIARSTEACMRVMLGDSLPPLAILEPFTGNDYDTWIANVSDWRATELKAMQYPPSSDFVAYDSFSFSVAGRARLLLHVFGFDALFYSPAALAMQARAPQSSNSSFTVEKFMMNVTARLGPVHTVVVWLNLPQLGLDWRDQFALLDGIPGGNASMQAIASDFHAWQDGAVTVLLGFATWDNATVSSNPHEPVVDRLQDRLTTWGWDGLYPFNTAALNASFYETAKPPPNILATDGPLSTPVDASSPAALAFTPLSMARWWLDVQSAGDATTRAAAENGISPLSTPITDESEPPVSSYKALEHRHTPLVGTLGDVDRAFPALAAALSAGGIAASEFSWGIENPISERDAARINRTVSMLLYCNEALSNGLDSPPNATAQQADEPGGFQWMPYIPVLVDGVESGDGNSVRASAMVAPLAVKSSTAEPTTPVTNVTVWIVCNFGQQDVQSVVIDTTDLVGFEVAGVADLYHGSRLEVQPNGSVALAAPLEAGSAVFLAAFQEEPSSLDPFLAAMADLTAVPLVQLPGGPVLAPQLRQPNRPALPASSPPNGMALIAGGPYLFNVSEVVHPLVVLMPESAQLSRAGLALGTQFPWEPAPSTDHSHFMTMPPFYMDKKLVTNEDYSLFVNSTGYFPEEATNWLLHWQQGPDGPTAPVAADSDRPVIWVSRQDAQAYASWLGKRLPTEWELQYAGQGNTTRPVPWSETADGCDTTHCPPAVTSGSQLPANVSSVPIGDAPGGISDIVGLVWQMTDMYCSQRSCAVVLKGGSQWAPAQPLYFPRTTRLDRHVRLPVMGDSSTRSAWVGFRCVRDVSFGRRD